MAEINHPALDLLNQIEREREEIKARIFTRPGEICLKVVDPQAGKCAKCKETIALAHFAWAEKSTEFPNDGHYTSWESENDRFDSYRHASGKEPCHPDRGSEFLLPQCPECKRWETLTSVQEAYGDRESCSACDYTRFFDIGD